MATDDLKVHFYLTPRGWVKGTRWFFDHVQNAEYPRPADTIATYQLHITQRSEWSPESRDWRELWRAEAVSPGEVEQAIEKFGKPTEDTAVLPE